jgi:hypothetical protein
VTIFTTVGVFARAWLNFHGRQQRSGPPSALSAALLHERIDATEYHRGIFEVSNCSTRWKYASISICPHWHTLRILWLNESRNATRMLPESQSHLARRTALLLSTCRVSMLHHITALVLRYTLLYCDPKDSDEKEAYSSDCIDLPFIP